MRETDPRYHPNLHLLSIERTGWRRYVFGRWVYSSEPFRRDIQRKIARYGGFDAELHAELEKGQRLYDPQD